MYTNYHCTSSIMHMVRNYNWDFISTVFRGEQIQRSVVVYRVLSICLYICVGGWGRERVATSQPNAPGSFLKIVKAGAFSLKYQIGFNLVCETGIRETTPTQPEPPEKRLLHSTDGKRCPLQRNTPKEGYLSYTVHLPVHPTSLRLLRRNWPSQPG